MINPPENRPLQFYLSQRSQPLDPDEDSFFLNNSNEKHECKRPDNLLPAFPSNLEQFVKDSMQSSLKNSSSNMGSGRILLPNPYPKKNSQRNSLFSEEIYENQKFQEKLVQPYKNPTKSRNNSFSIEEFKQYNKKFQGKQLSERLDIISKEFESKVMGDLKKLEDKISESKSSNIVILKANLCSPKPNKVDLSLNDKNNIFYEKTQINNTNETLNERYVSIEKKEEKAFVSLNKKTFSSNSKFDHTNELEYSPFSNKPSNENSRSDLLATQSQKKELIKIEEFTNIKPKEFNIQKVNEKIKKDQELFQKRNSLHKKKDFLIQTNISPSNQELMTQFRNLSVSPINNSSLIRETSYKNTKSNYTEKKSNYSEKKSNYSERKSNYSKNCKNNSSDKKSSYSEKKSNYSEKKDRFDDTKIEISKNKGNYRDEICQANFESFDQYFVTKNDMRKELNIDEDENFRSLGDPLFEPTKFLNFEENKEENLFDKKLRSNSIKENEERKEKNENL